MTAPTPRPTPPPPPRPIPNGRDTRTVRRTTTTLAALTRIYERMKAAA